MVEFKSGHIFNTKAQTIVNTVNCVGVMGKGIALVFKLRYPKMFVVYKEHCNAKRISPGKLWLYKSEKNAPWVLNFPTKFHWKYPSKMEYLELGLEKFLKTYEEQGIQSVAFPLLGTHNGGLEKERVKDMMNRYLSKCKIPVEIFEYDPDAPDDMYILFVNKWKSISADHIKKLTGLRQVKIQLIQNAIEDENVQSMISLLAFKGIGLKSIEKCFSFVMSVNDNSQLFE